MSNSAEEEATRRLLAQYAEVAEIAGSLAHEIKNPLSVIRMNVDLLAEDFSAPQDLTQRRALKKINTLQGQCERLQNLLDDFLKFVRLRSLDLAPASLNRVVERVLDFFEPQCEQQGVDVTRYLASDLPSVLLDAQLVYAAVLNLVKNGIEAMPDGGQLLARTREVGAGVALDLIDTGCGMEPQTAVKMFEPFYTTKQGGSGLGLPITRRIIDAHGGRIDVHSEAGRGTQFTLTFPLPARLAGGDELAEPASETANDAAAP